MYRSKQIGIIGAGRAGSSLAVALHTCGINVQAVIDSDVIRAKKCAALTDAKIADDTIAALAGINVIFLAVPDEAIAQLAADLAAARVLSSEAFAVHLSGVMPVSLLQPLKDLGILTAVCHPCMSLNFAEENVFAGAAVALEGDEQVREFLIVVMEALGAKPLNIPADKKIIYHAACCMASNYLVTLLNLSATLLQKAGVEADSDIFGPLVRQTLANIEEHGYKKGLTGPILRGDVVTVEKHLAAISQNCPEILPVYKSLGLATIDLAALSTDAETLVREMKTILK